MCRVRLLAILVLLGVAAAGYPQESAQEHVSPADRPLSSYRWSVSISIAGQSEGPLGDLEDAMRAGAFDQTASKVSEGDRTHPYTSGGNFGWAMLTVGYRLKPRIELRLQAAQDREFGSVHGYHGPPDTPPSPAPPDRAYLAISPSIQTFAALVSYARPKFWVGAGPSLNRTRIEFDDRASVWSESDTLAGLVVEAGGEWPGGRRVGLELWGQYHLIGSQAYAPVPASGGGQLVATLPAGSVSFSHFTAGFSFKLRLGRSAPPQEAS